MFKFKDLQYTAGYFDQHEITLVDRIHVRFEDVSADKQCKRKEGIYPKVEIRKAGEDAWNEGLIPIWDRRYRQKEYIMKMTRCTTR